MKRAVTSLARRAKPRRLGCRTVACLAARYRNLPWVLISPHCPQSHHPMRRVHSTAQQQGLGKYYHIEASNAERKDATKLTVRGPDVDGILASMTVALTVQGCSLVELHAAVAPDVSHDKIHDSENRNLIEDVFFVVHRQTGAPFANDELEGLAQALLEAAKSPMKVMSIKGAVSEVDNLEAYLRDNVPVPERQITIVPGSVEEN